jgi:hypothetical protein
MLLLDQPLQQARELVGAAAGAGHDDELNRLLRLPRDRRPR